MIEWVESQIHILTYIKTFILGLEYQGFPLLILKEIKMCLLAPECISGSRHCA